jgi:hypothetical protein
MIIGFLIGFLAVAAAVSAISSVLIGFGARIFTKQPIPFAKRFWISFAAVVTALVLQWTLQAIGAAFLAPVPAIAFFAVSWLLITQFLNTAPESKSGNAIKGLLVTVFQSFSMLLIGLVVALAIVGLTRR